MPPQHRSRPVYPQFTQTKVTRSLVRRNDPSADVLLRLRQALDVRNSQGLRSSFDLQSNEWVEFSYTITSKTAYAAHTLPLRVPQTPLCPHILNVYHGEDKCHMKIHHDGARSYWKAKTHQCDFISKCASLVFYSLLTVLCSLLPLFKQKPFQNPMSW